MKDKFKRILYRFEDSINSNSYRKEWEEQNILIDRLEQQLSKSEKRYKSLLRKTKILENELEKYKHE